MDKTKNVKITSEDSISDELTHDDMDMLQQVLERTRGSYPNEPYRPSEYVADYEPEA